MIDKEVAFLTNLDLEDLAKEMEAKFDDVVDATSGTIDGNWTLITDEFKSRVGLFKEYALKSNSLLILIDKFRTTPFKFESLEYAGFQLRSHRIVWRVKPELRIRNYDQPNWSTGDDTKIIIPVEYSIYMRFAIEEF